MVKILLNILKSIINSGRPDKSPNTGKTAKELMAELKNNKDYQQKIKDRNKQSKESSNTYKELNKALKKEGAVSKLKWNIDGLVVKSKSPIDIMVNAGSSALPYADIILDYAPKLKGNELEMVVRAISEKGFNKATPFLLTLFKNPDEYELKDTHLWVVGNALHLINDKDAYPEILVICKNKSYGRSRQMLMGVLSRIKTPEAYNVLIESLGDETVKAHAIEAIGRFGNLDAIPILESTNVKEGLYEAKAKKTALRRLERAREKQLAESR